MTDTKKFKTPLNQLVKTTTVESFNSGYDTLIDYAVANDLERPNKGVYLDKIIESGLKSITPEVFFKNEIA